MLPRVLGAVLLVACAGSTSAQTEIRLNQIGFYPDQPKVAVVVAASADSFYVHPAGEETVVFRGALGTGRIWSPSAETVKQADFSALREAGTYELDVPGLGRSYPFRIAARVHEEVARASLKAFYFQRASIALTAPYAGGHARPAGHPDTNVLVHASAASTGRPAGTAISAPKGWYDAGDYNKYVVNSGISTGTLLQLYEHFPAYAGALDLNIPESGVVLPDLLEEALWNIRWMLAMQDPGDGGVYHKLTTANFSGFVMPNQATATRYVVQKSTAAALDFAAVMAQASRIFAGFEMERPGLSDSLLTAALDAWMWARAHPNVAYNQGAVNSAFDPDISTGEYGDSSFGDEFDWAAMELYITTAADSFLTATSPTSPIQMGLPWWGGVRELGYYSLLAHREAVAADVDTTALKSALLTAANHLRTNGINSAYGVPMGGDSWNFGWGSNSSAANQGIQLLQAYRLTQDPAYLDAALANLDYLLGRNATGYSFLTGYGSRTPLNPHHRPSASDGIAAPVPGLLAGGPNPGQEDGCSGYPSALPARSYVDLVCSYASNEIAINWNAPMAYLAGALEAILSPTGTPSGIEPGEEPQDTGMRLMSYPNPFRGATTIRFELAKAAPVSVAVYDLLGRRVRMLLDEPIQTAGWHETRFEASGLPGGIYLCRVTTQEGTRTQRVVLTAAE